MQNNVLDFTEMYQVPYLIMKINSTEKYNHNLDALVHKRPNSRT